MWRGCLPPEPKLISLKTRCWITSVTSPGLTEDMFDAIILLLDGVRCFAMSGNDCSAHMICQQSPLNKNHRFLLKSLCVQYINTPDCSFEGIVKCLMDVCYPFPHSSCETGTCRNRLQCGSLILEWIESIYQVVLFSLPDSIGFTVAYVWVFWMNSSFYRVLEMLVDRCMSFPTTLDVLQQAFHFWKRIWCWTFSLFPSMSAFIWCPSDWRCWLWEDWLMRR